IASIAQLRKVQNAARLAGQTLLWFAITAAIAVSIGITLGTTLQPGSRIDTGALETAEPGRVGGWWDFLIGLVPQNFLGLTVSTSVSETGDVSSSVGFNVLQVIVIAAAIGIAALKLGKRAEPFLEFTQSAL